MQKYGHRPVILLGGGTTLIGDPSGKENTRKILSEPQIKKNIKSIKKVFNKLLSSKVQKQNLYLLIIQVGLKNWNILSSLIIGSHLQ